MRRGIFLILCFFLLAGQGCQSARPAELKPARTVEIPAEFAMSSQFREVFVKDTSYDAKTGEVAYALAEPALVRIRIGIPEGGPLLRHLLDWEYRDAGRHVEVWDKKDDTGQIDFSQMNNAFIVVACIAPGEKQDSREENSVIRGYRRSPKVTVTFPESAGTTSEGVPVVSGNVPVRVTVAGEDIEWLRETKYEVGLYVDYTFLAEDEQGTNPFTYYLDTRGLNEGRHSITANIIGYTGEVGTVSIPVYVRNQS